MDPFVTHAQISEQATTYESRLPRFGFWVGLWVALTSAAVNIRSISHDNIPNVLIPISVLRDGDFELSEFQPLIHSYQDRVCYWAVPTERGVFSRYPVWTGVTAAPFFLPYALVGPVDVSEAGLLKIGRFAAIFACGVFAGTLAIGLRRYMPDRWAALLAMLTVLGTTIQHQLGSNLSNQSLPLVCVAGVTILMLPGRMTWVRAICAGLLAGLAVAARPQALAVAGAPLGLFLSERPLRRMLPAVLAGFLVFPALTMAYHHVAFGGVFQTGYGDEPGTGFTAPFWEGALGLLLSPSCGLFVYSPWLILGVVGAWRCFKGDSGRAGNRYGRWLILGVVGQWLVLSKWWAWNGALSFGGNRMLAETIPALVVLMGLGTVRAAKVEKHAPVGGRWLLGLGILAILHFAVGTVAYDAVAPSDPPKANWDITRDFIALYVSRDGWLRLVIESLKAVGLMGSALLLGGYLVRRFVSKIALPSPEASHP